jgi:hypothetical protein
MAVAAAVVLPIQNWLPKDHALARFKDDADQLWHHRVILRIWDDGFSTTLSPDRQRKISNFVVGVLYSEIRPYDGRRLPAGVRAADCYRDRDSSDGAFTEDEIREHMERAMVHVRRDVPVPLLPPPLPDLPLVPHRRRQAAKGLDVAGFGTPVGGSLTPPEALGIADGLVPPITGPAGEVLVWICVQASAGYQLGGEIDVTSLHGSEVSYALLGLSWFAVVWPGSFQKAQPHRDHRLEPALFEQIPAVDVAIDVVRLTAAYLNTLADNKGLTEAVRHRVGSVIDDSALAARFGVQAGKAATAVDTPRGDVPEENDIRTLHVDYDKQGRRYKIWKDVVAESHTEHYSDLPACCIGSPIALDAVVAMERAGGTPSLWLSELARDKRLARTDRNYKELKALADAVEVGGGYDQLNVGGCMIFEIILRRAAAVAESIAKGADRPDWSVARHITAEADSLSLLTPAKAAEVSKKAKEDLEAQVLRQRLTTASGQTGAGSSGGHVVDVSGIVDVGGLPASGPVTAPSGADRGRSRGRGGRQRRLTAGQPGGDG